jgi:hypothetical protein
LTIRHESGILTAVNALLQAGVNRRLPALTDKAFSYQMESNHEK